MQQKIVGEAPIRQLFSRKRIFVSFGVSKNELFCASSESFVLPPSNHFYENEPICVQKW